MLSQQQKQVLKVGLFVAFLTGATAMSCRPSRDVNDNRASPVGDWLDTAVVYDTTQSHETIQLSQLVQVREDSLPSAVADLKARSFRPLTLQEATLLAGQQPPSPHASFYLVRAVGYEGVTDLSALATDKFGDQLVVRHPTSRFLLRKQPVIVAVNGSITRVVLYLTHPR